MPKLISLMLITLLLSACGSFGNYVLDVGDTVRTQRGFFQYEGPDAQLLSHTIAVGHPGGVSYVYDLETGRLVGVWAGSFIDARGMWQGRGRGAFTALGEVRFLGSSHPLQVEGAQPDSFRGLGYRLDESSGAPIFQYSYGPLEVIDKVLPLAGNNGIQHQISLSQISDKLQYEIATADSIVSLDDGSYAAGDADFVISGIRGGTPRLEVVDGRSSLLLDISEPILSYSVSW